MARSSNSSEWQTADSRHRRIQRILHCFMASLVIACFAFSVAAAENESPAELVHRLSTHYSSLPSERALVERIAGLGDEAIPALEKELHLGIRFRELNRMLQAGESRRVAVVLVLAKIPGERSTDLLVCSLADPPDSYGMLDASLQALSKRSLSESQIEVLIGSRSPDVVIAGIAHVAKAPMSPRIEAALKRVFDPNTARVQFVNEYGAKTISEEGSWAVRLAAGKALHRDMVPDMRQRAQRLLRELQSEVSQPTTADEAESISNMIPGILTRLAALGEPAKEVVLSAAGWPPGTYAQYLDMVLARLGDRSRDAKVADYLVSSTDVTIRFCAVLTLRCIRAASARPALWKALRDPYHRSDLMSVREIYPVRIAAADALIELGEDRQRVWQRVNEP